MPRWGLKWITLKWCNKNEVIKYGEKFITSSKMKNKMKCQTRKDTNGMKIARRKFVWKDSENCFVQTHKIVFGLKGLEGEDIICVLVVSKNWVWYFHICSCMDFWGIEWTSARVTRDSAFRGIIRVLELKQHQSWVQIHRQKSCILWFNKPLSCKLGCIMFRFPV